MAKEQFQPPKGMSDIEPKEMARRQWVYSRVKEVCERFGFRETDPTFIENFETLAAKAGADIDQEIYSFVDKAGRKLGLRFEQTLGLARMIATGSFPMPQKLFCISPNWRYDTPQAGRYRCFWQWDIEIFGSREIEADAEVIAATAEITSALGIKDFEIRIGSRKLATAILNWLGIKNKTDVENALRTVDKIEKLKKEELLKEFKKCGFEKVQAGEILNALARKGEPKKILAQIKKDFPAVDSKNVELISEAIAELERLFDALQTYKVIDKCVLDLSIVRGLTYYTGIVYEVFDKNNEDLGAIAGGGRFDNLVSIFGKDVPATGCAGGIERLLLAIEKNRAFSELKMKPDYFVIAVDDKTRYEVQKIVQKLRAKGIAADADLMKRSLSAQMEYAAKIGVPKALIVGPAELKEGKVTLRDMTSGKQEKISLDEIK